MTHVAHSTGNNEWYTPPELIEAARGTMGRIDLDPASSPIAQQWIKAGSYYTKEDNGLLLSWGGRVWINPPYEKGLVERFIDKLLDSLGVEQAITLTNNATETGWGQKILTNANVLCFPSKRIKFIGEQGPKKTPLQGQMIAGFGVDRVRFGQEFAPYGAVVFPMGNSPVSFG